MEVKKSLKHVQTKQCINACMLNIMNVIYSSFDEVIAMAFNGNHNYVYRLQKEDNNFVVSALDKISVPTKFCLMQGFIKDMKLASLR